jgi:hypothetical protein
MPSAPTHSRGGGDTLYDGGGDQRRHERQQTESISNTITVGDPFREP